jgi:hypothetical protein
MDHRTWAITNDGFAVLGILPIMPRHARRPKPHSRRERNAKARARRNIVRRDALVTLERPENVRRPWIKSDDAASANDLATVD